ncbi:M15 family metallopeptidase [Clostridium tarantellae]|uniref:M15 family peptidase n=1 Tax=Clostridium tarantellae TaxID=39493 RepID=A0A6I1MN31_9CLOT|nr:M15 family metallopeptidase [Clostridium tarantellae]MPQ44434.1 M15 family peptidase [Clostridium tarantellae]
MSRFKKIVCFFILIMFLFNTKVICSIKEYNEDYILNTKVDLLTLKLAYNEYIKTLEKDNKGYIYLVFNNGKKIIYDDNKEKNYEEKLANPDLQDMLETPYKLNMIKEIEEKNIDPGRIRVYDLLNIVYGNGEKNIRSNLTMVKSYYGNFQFNKENHGAENLKKVMDNVKIICKENNRIVNYVCPISGTFNYRVISGTGRLSAHSYGIAIDLKRDNADYWKWTNKEKARARIYNYPEELVKVFEDNGFIWGGKWNHFDILHFEYRPEFIIKSKYFNKDDIKNKECWYYGINVDDDILNYISKIEEILK